MSEATVDTTNGIIWRRRLPGLILLASVAALLVAYAAEHVFGLRPCNLCLWQRVPYFAAVALALTCLAASDERICKLALAGCALAFVSGAGVALHHVGVEQHWWGSIASCGGELPVSMSTSDFLAALSAPPDLACDVPTWVMFGLSATVWNVLLSAVLAAITILGVLLAVSGGTISGMKGRGR